VLLGGYVYPRTGVALGPLANATLSQLHVHKLIMSTGGVTEQGLYNSNLLLVETERAMMKAADEVIVVADSSKFGHPNLSFLCGLDEVHRMVVDTEISEDWRKKIDAAGVKLVLAGETKTGSDASKTDQASS
jgi:DeoR family transcriptional regulator, fructose operon transcriptional repressor